MRKLKNCLKRNSFYLILILLLFSFMRCQFIIDMYSEEDTTVAPEILPYFKEGDTLVYNSGMDVDSFCVETAFLYAVGEDDGDDLNYERFISSMLQIDCADSCYKSGSTITPIEYWIGVFGFVHSSYKLVDYYSGNTLEIGSYQLEELYGSYNLEPDSITGKEINYVLYSKKYGVIEYKFTNGEEFIMIEETLEMLMGRE
ncbi:MAG: hypothetical protein PF541_17425 [Prolixibacteraceae bacterium]|nr:hypothetical protein [Prolixibacteraceae bacterium]